MEVLLVKDNSYFFSYTFLKFDILINGKLNIFSKRYEMSTQRVSAISKIFKDVIVFLQLMQSESEFYLSNFFEILKKNFRLDSQKVFAIYIFFYKRYFFKMFFFQLAQKVHTAVTQVFNFTILFFNY